MKKIVLIPAYEPDENLIELLEKLSKIDVSVIVVDDGSGEEYEDIFEEAEKYAYVISYKTNRGKGYALKKGFKYIEKNYIENYTVITMDSDGQHTVEDAIKLADYLEEHPNELVLGKRLRGKNTPLRSRIGNGTTRVVYKISTGVSIYDTQTGLRAFTDKLMDIMLDIEGDRYEYEMNVLLKLPKLKVKMHEIEIKTIYLDNNSKSHFNPFKDSIRIYKQIIRFSLSSIISFIIDYILYNLFLLIFKNINIANVLARIISATANYTMNRNLVFKSKVSIKKSLSEYVLLACIILTLNTLILNLFVNTFGINASVAKILVEIILFTFSWIIQKQVIFTKKKK